jgi:hypothetical protein
MSTAIPDSTLPPFNKSKHITYWLRCLKTFLPWQYTSNDSNRMMLAYFTVSALDILSSLETSTTPAERADYVNWIYKCQHPQGGFRGFPGTDFGELANESNSVWDPANVPATYFALATLLILRDDLTRVKRSECLGWLSKMQRPDGSFGQTLGVEEGQIEGGTDTRFAYTAVGIRWILGGEYQGVGDVNVENLVQYIKRLQVRLYIQSVLSSPKSCTDLNSSHMMAEWVILFIMNLTVRVSVLAMKRVTNEYRWFYMLCRERLGHLRPNTRWNPGPRPSPPMASI